MSMSTRELCAVMETLYGLNVMVVTELYIFSKIKLQLKWANFSTCKFYLNRAVKTK